MADASENERILSGVKYRDQSGTVTASNVSQTLMAENLSRDHAFIGNPNVSGSLWVNDLGGTAAANGAGCTEIVPGQTVVTNARNLITITGATSAKFTAGEA